MGNSRVWQLLAQGKGSAGSRLPGGPPGRLAAHCCHGAHHRPDLRGTLVGPGVGVRAQEEARVLWDISFVNLWEITLLGPQRQALGCPCKVACKKHQQLPPRLPVTVGPTGQSEAGSHPSADSDSLFPGGTSGSARARRMLPPSLPKSRTNLAMSASHRDTAGEVKETRSVESIVRMWKKFPQSRGPGLRT